MKDCHTRARAAGRAVARGPWLVVDRTLASNGRQLLVSFQL
jgi:hypothetical protein